MSLVLASDPSPSVVLSILAGWGAVLAFMLWNRRSAKAWVEALKVAILTGATTFALFALLGWAEDHGFAEPLKALAQVQAKTGIPFEVSLFGTLGLISLCFAILVRRTRKLAEES